MSKKQIDRKMIVNDDGWIMNFNKKGIDKNTLKTEMIDRYSGSPVDTISWCVGEHEVYDYETQIGEIFGAGQEVEKDKKKPRPKARLEEEVGFEPTVHRCTRHF